MTTSTSLIEMILNLLKNPSELEAFKADPESYLAACGAGDATAADLHDALVLAEHDDDSDGAEDHHTGGNHHPVPPAPHPAPGETEHEAAVRYLTHVTNNYVDDRDTVVDNSVNQQIDTHGGDFDQDIDVRSTVASGDGSVAAGGHISDSTITTGDHNQVGDGNIAGNGNVVGDGNLAVTGNGNTTAFGDGDASSANVRGDVNVGDGGAFASGGDALVDNSDNSLHDVDNTTTDESINDSFHDHSDHSVHDSGNVDLDASVNHSGNSESHTSVSDSHNTDAHFSV